MEKLNLPHLLWFFHYFWLSNFLYCYSDAHMTSYFVFSDIFVVKPNNLMSLYAEK